MNEAERQFKEKGNVSIKATLPILFWEEWEKDCKDNFNNTYYQKMQYDHKYRVDMQIFIDSILVDMLSLKQEVFELKAEVEALKQPVNTNNTQSQTPKVKTMGGNV